MNINGFQILFQIINFSILLFLLKKYLYKPVLKILEERAKKIHQGLEAAEKSIHEREKLEKVKRKMLVEAEKSASDVLNSARIQAKKVESKLTKKAEIALEKRVSRAEALAKTKAKQLEQELEKRFAQTVISTSQSMLQDSLTAKEQKTIVSRHIKALKKVSFSSK